MIYVEIGIKTQQLDYRTARKNFTNEDHLQNYLNRLEKAGSKVTSIHPREIPLNDWSWDRFFNCHPDYIAKKTWKNANLMVSFDASQFSDKFTTLMLDKDFVVAKEVYGSFKTKNL